MTGSATLRFTNEAGNEIVIEVVQNGPKNFARFSLSGPDSMIESYLTHMELTNLRDACIIALRAPNGGTNESS